MENKDIFIYQGKNGRDVEVRVESDTIWLPQKGIAALFDVDRTVITKHISNICKDGELQKDSVCAKIAHTAEDGKTYRVDYYNLDMILSVGYRVNSKTATLFRIWATSVLKKYLTEGYAVNERRLTEYREKLDALRQVVSVVGRAAENQIENLDPMVRELLNVAAEFAGGFEVLDNYDHEKLDAKGRTADASEPIPVEKFLDEIKKMRPKFGGLFGVPKDESFESSVRQIYQSVGGEDAYPALEEKAANLLYLITKNHSFADGNKRIAATCFAYFLMRNKMLWDDRGRKCVDDYALAALTLLIAESKPAEKETMCRLVITILNKR